MIMAGGTGGHIFPALAVARQVTDRNIPVVWLGSRGGMEETLVAKQGIPMVALSVRGLRGKGLGTLLLAPFKLSLAVSQAVMAILRYKPRAVLGLGGFASGPGGIAAWILRKPLYVHEQNAIPGMTNRWLARISRCVMEGFPGSFRMVATICPVVHTGNPVRQEIVALPPVNTRMAERTGALRLLVIGGSLGALKLNQVVPAAVASLQNRNIEIRHQCGARHLDATLEAYADTTVAARIEPFIEDMAEAYGWADLVIARAGALTVSELIQVGVAALLVPYPHAVDDHQTANANVLVDTGAAHMMKDAELTPESLGSELAELLTGRDRLQAMAEASALLKTPEAAEHVARICLGEMAPEQQLTMEASA
jgi:UDP-N-acetylglucosamine--N-acetylmuramyl-(pentapeptide) pyrophosphoryl-undecaprenol N-acetylglucosamine transferase